MNYRPTLPVFLLLAGVLLPGNTYAATVPDLSHLYEANTAFQSAIAQFPGSGRVLGATTDTTSSAKVATKLGAAKKSLFKDISIKPPKGWMIDDDYEVTEDNVTRYSTYVVEDGWEAAIIVERFDGEGVEVADVVDEVKELCEVCGYKIIGEGSGKLGKVSTAVIDATSAEARFQFHVFKYREVAYVVTLIAPKDKWNKYYGIMVKSASSLKFTSR
jgi:hypothetical protein